MIEEMLYMIFYSFLSYGQRSAPARNSKKRIVGNPWVTLPATAILKLCVIKNIGVIIENRPDSQKCGK